MSEAGLKVEIVGGVLKIEIGIKALAFACEHAPKLARYDDKANEYRHPVVTDPDEFAKEVLRELQSEAEDGTTMVHLMLDNAMEEAIEQGATGVRMPGE